MSDDVPTRDLALFIGTGGGKPVTFPFAELLQHHADVRDAIARTIHGQHALSANLATFVATRSFVYAFNTYKAIGLLLPEQYHESAAVLLRQLWEVSLNLHWIERDQSARSEDFCNFTIMEYRKLIQKRGGPVALQHFDGATREFQAKFHYRDRRGRNRKHSTFAGRSTHDRAIELGEPWKKEYELVYGLASLHTHGAPGAVLQSYFRQHYPAPEVRERDSTALVAILSINVLVRDLHVVRRAKVVESCDEVDTAFASFQQTMDRLEDRLC